MSYVRRLGAVAGLIISSFVSSNVFSQDLNIKNAKSWEMTGRAQLQHVFNSDVASDASKTRQGFRIRRGRFQVKSVLNDYIQTKFQIEVRDNSPKLKDAEGKLKLGQSAFLRVGQFKVPVWREELRSSGKLMLVERSGAAGFLADMNLSARHIGLEFGVKTDGGIEFAANYSNGAGEGGREDAGRTKSSSINNGKLFTGRINVPVGDKFQVGVSAVASQDGNDIGGVDNSGTTTVIAPDFGLYLPVGEKGVFDLEAGVALGSQSSDFTGRNSDNGFFLFDVTGRWGTKLNEPVTGFGGMDGFELAAGYSIVDLDFGGKVSTLRFGPAFGFGKQTRLQINAEIENEDGVDESEFKLRSQITFNF